MKFYSDLTRKFYSTADACVEAENLYKKEKEEKEEKEAKLKNERKARAEEVNKAYVELTEAGKKYHDLREQFVRDYGSYHMTYSSNNVFDPLFSLFF